MHIFLLCRERGEYNMELGQLLKIADSLQVSPQELVYIA